MFQEGLTLDDVLLVPQHSDIESRKGVDISSELIEGRKVLPIISSPMDTVTEEHMVWAMEEHRGFGIIHRYMSIEDQVAKCSQNRSLPNPRAAAIGATGDFLERAKALVDAGVEILCIDVAHGDHSLVRKALEVLKSEFENDIHLMAGNVATFEGYSNLVSWGADSVRIGIGGGSICSTRIQTGHGVPNFSALMGIVNGIKNNLVKKVPIILDGGIRNAGDIVKALAAGADFVMVGSLLAGTEETPGKLIQTPHGLSKVYRGMASREAQTDWRKSSSAPEGISTTIPYRGSVKPILKDLIGNIQSGFSYTGARNLSELRSKAKFIKQSSASMRESSTHIINRYGR